MKKRRKHYRLQTVYITTFLSLVAVPILLVFLGTMLYLGGNFKKQAVENIRTAHETVIVELVTEMKNLSIWLSHMMYTNDGEIIALAAETDTEDMGERYEAEQELNSALLMTTEPLKNFVSAGFSMKSGRVYYFKEDLAKAWEQLQEEEWYQLALKRSNVVTIGSAQTGMRMENKEQAGHFYMVAAVAPDFMTDRSQKLEMLFLLQDLEVARQIRDNNRGYLKGNNHLGLSRIVDAAGKVLYEPDLISEACFDSRKYTMVRSEIPVYGESWFLESYVDSQSLYQGMGRTAVLLTLLLLIILLLFFVFSLIFLKNIIRPLEEVRRGLRQIEDGDLNVHITPSGQSEIRQIIHAFNAMGRRMRALITEYEERVRRMEHSPQELFEILLRGDDGEGCGQMIEQEFFSDPYRVLSAAAEGLHQQTLSEGELGRMFHEFEQNPRFAAHCVWVLPGGGRAVIFYRRAEEGQDHEKTMVEALQKTAEAHYDIRLDFCIGSLRQRAEEFSEEVEKTGELLALKCLYGKAVVLDREQDGHDLRGILQKSSEMQELASAIYMADERGILKGRDQLMEQLNSQELSEGRKEVLALIYALSGQFEKANDRFDGVFGQKIDYKAKLEKLDDRQQLCMWALNYISWIWEYTRGISPRQETDLIQKAKRYIQEHYSDKELSLKMLAEYVELNEKYLSTRFTKEAGENFQSYLTGLRIEKAKELLRTSQFKIYEIAEMTGYTTPEHFNRMFKKTVGISPAQYRKQEKL